jgi:hypothetical protein
LKIAKPIVSKPITMLINKTIENASFPNKLKEAQVVPLHKKNSQLEVGNYRPMAFFQSSIIFNSAVLQPKPDLNADKEG